MKPRARRYLLVILFLPLLLLAAAYFLLDAWLESAGGRRAVERALTERIGMPVTLQGEFRVMLLPAPGVSGTGLVVGEPGPETEVLSSEGYAVSLALAPLLERRLVVESVRFSDGMFHFERWPATPAPDDAASAATIQLPEIARLQLHDFGVLVTDGDSQPYLLRKLEIVEFAAGRGAPFELEIEGAGSWTGSLLWSPAEGTLEVTAAGTAWWPGELRLRAQLGLAGGRGVIDANWVAPSRGAGAAIDARASFSYASTPGGLRMDDLLLAVADMTITGHGCLFGEQPPQIHLELASDRVDLDGLPDLAAFGGSGEAKPSSDAASPTEPGGAGGFDFHVRLSAAQMSAGDVLARDAVLQFGGVPDCAGLKPDPRGQEQGG